MLSVYGGPARPRLSSPEVPELNRFFCQRMTVSGLTRTRKDRQLSQSRESNTQNNRSRFLRPRPPLLSLVDRELLAKGRLL